MMGDQYAIADMATFPWVRTLSGYDEAAELVGTHACPNVQSALERFVTRRVIKGLLTP